MVTRVGAIGLGEFALIQMDGWVDRSDVRIAAGSDISADAREAFEVRYDRPTYEDYEAMFDEADLDAVFIATPHTLHYQHAVDALDRDLHVLLEKPMVTETGHAVDLVRRADERELVLTVGYQRHCHPAYQAARELLQDGRIGDVHMASCHIATDWLPNAEGTWRANPDLSGGGQLFDCGSHLLDALLWTTDAEPGQVAATMDYRDYDVDVNTALAATLEGPDGPITASIGISGDGNQWEESLVIWGTEGLLRIEDGLTIEEGDSQEEQFFDTGADWSVVHKKMNGFVDAVQGKRDNPIPGELCLQVAALTDAACQAVESGQTVDVSALIEEARVENET
jgi:predicted dehydrogenase